MNEATIHRTPITLAGEEIHSSSEALDGSSCSVSVVYPGNRVDEIWILERFIMPSGREYEVEELRWLCHGDGYMAMVRGRAPTRA